ncbi:MAG: glycerophosphodiester phosphodiesterase family protein [Aeromicrobium sp.]
MSQLWDSPGPYAWAHRGGALLPANVGIENTLRAFRNAVELGYTLLETDVHASRDGVLYAFHDANLLRMTGRAARINDLTSAELDDLRVDGREPIPRIAELVEEFADCRFSIDVKADDAVDLAVDEFKRLGMTDRLLIGAFDHGRIVRLRAGLPGVVSALSQREIARLAAGLPIPRNTVASVPVSWRGVPVITPRFVARAQRRGIPVFAWTIDDAAEMARLLDLGVDGIMADQIDDLRDLLMERGQW